MQFLDEKIIPTELRKMTRSKAGLKSEIRFADHLSVGLLARVFPLALINETLDTHACNSARVRSFPASTVVYYTMALSLFPNAAYEEVFSAVVQGLSHGDRAPAAVVKSTISKARSRLDWRALQAIQRRCCRPLSMPAHPNAFFAGHRLVAIESAVLEVCDQKENVQSFGYPAGSGEQGGGPQARYAILVECASHAILDAELGACSQTGAGIATPLLRSLAPGMLCLSDGAALNWSDWNAAKNTGAQLLWRIAGTVSLPVEKMLGDGSYLSRLQPAQEERENGSADIVVRIIERRLPGVSADTPKLRLLTTLLDEQAATADVLTALYCERPQVDLHLAQSRRTLRSKTPELVRQEFYGWVMAHYAVRCLMYRGAAPAELAERSMHPRVGQYAACEGLP